MPADAATLPQFRLPDFADAHPDALAGEVRAILAEYRDTVARIRDQAEPSFDSLIAPMEELSERKQRCFGVLGHLHGVADNEAIRAVYGPLLEELTTFGSELMQDEVLAASMHRLAADLRFQREANAAQRRIVEHWLRDFRLGGVDLPEPARSRFREIETELAGLSTAFEEAVLDSTDGWSLPVTAEQLAGLPESALAILRDDRPEAPAPYRITLKFPSYNAVITYAQDRNLRERVYRAYGTRASELADDPRHDNGPRIRRIMALRQESAQLLGFANAAELSLATKMADSPAKVIAFLRELAARARPSAEADLAELRAFGAGQGIDALQPWDVPFLSEQLKSLRFGLDDEALRPYFPLDRVLAGLFAVIERLFGLQAVECAVPTWHADVRHYRLIDADGRAVAAFYTDFYAREKKRGGAWMDVCTARFRRSHELQAPVAYLVCNFAAPVDGKPALLTHDDVVTLFHEMGHGLHHLLTEVDLPSVSGISGVEWDAVELPSQLMENYCWEAEGLALISGHVDTGAPLPDAWIVQLKASKNFQAGLFLLRQLEFGLFDFHLHAEPERAADVIGLLLEVRREVAVLHPPEWNRMPMSFTHIFGGGYAAGYYSYLWAEVLSADAFEAFRAAGVFDRETGERYRREVLAQGGSRPAMQSFTAFRGREPEIGPLLQSYGLAA
ncbi:MAG: M3 family metallopeptidase [Xanthomonadales bacterium]|jgi:oligopeptidase A|nr:M3 family metallopeptidase [Xanthomonadales bacterium]